jgi:hypothetical protein
MSIRVSQDEFEKVILYADDVSICYQYRIITYFLNGKAIAYEKLKQDIVEYYLNK